MANSNSQELPEVPVWLTLHASHGCLQGTNIKAPGRLTEKEVGKSDLMENQQVDVAFGTSLTEKASGSHCDRPHFLSTASILNPRIVII